MSLVISTGATTEPVTVEEAIRQLRLGTDSGEEVIVKDMITASRRHLERYLGLSLASQSWRYSMDSFPEVIKLHKGPVTSITSLSYYDTDGTQQTLNVGTQIIKDLDSMPARVTPLSDASWPDTEIRVNAVEIVYVAGYTPTTIPGHIKNAILAGVTFLYDNRGDKDAEVPGWIYKIVEMDRFDLVL